MYGINRHRTNRKREDAYIGKEQRWRTKDVKVCRQHTCNISDGMNSLIPNRSQFFNEKLSRRPDRQQLVEQGILHESQCAPGLQFSERALKRARLTDELNNHLVNRPGPLELVQNKILHVNTTEHSHLEQAIQGYSVFFSE